MILVVFHPSNQLPCPARSECLSYKYINTWAHVSACLCHLPASYVLCGLLDKHYRKSRIGQSGSVSTVTQLQAGWPRKCGLIPCQNKSVLFSKTSHTGLCANPAYYTSQQDFGTRKVYCVSNITFHAESKYAIKNFPSPTVFVQWPF